ncbi:hypothetical protein ALI144C_19825 [Actinosynnema sp. ALI-1.44]|nr:hypothetical protein ALI144C_19825 [Actinosynnema sp. ALI-1.44]
MSDLLGIRGKFIDDALRQAVNDGVRQVGVLAAGLDSRAHRLPWPTGTTVFEIDQPAVLEFKRQVLAPAPSQCVHRLIPAESRDRWESPLREAGFDPGRIACSARGKRPPEPCVQALSTTAAGRPTSEGPHAG